MVGWKGLVAVEYPIDDVVGVTLGVAALRGHGQPSSLLWRWWRPSSSNSRPVSDCCISGLILPVPEVLCCPRSPATPLSSPATCAFPSQPSPPLGCPPVVFPAPPEPFMDRGIQRQRSAIPSPAAGKREARILRVTSHTRSTEQSESA